MKIWKDVLLDGVKIGPAFCESCARRHVYGLLWLRGRRDITMETLIKGMKTTDTTIEFTTCQPDLSKSKTSTGP